MKRKMSAKNLTFCLFPLVLSLPVMQASAQSTLAECSLMEDSQARLECYDRAIEQSSERSDLPVVRLPRASRPDNSSVAESTASNIPVERRDGFGLENQDSNNDEQRTFVVAQASHNDFTGWTIEFENGQVWRQVGTEDYRIAEGDRYTIQRALMNSFMLGNSENNRKIRVKRIE